MLLTSLETPALILDRRKMVANVARMDAQLERLGIGFRPHVKTAKCIEVARIMMERGVTGITVSTLKEAEYFLGHGIRDIIYAVGVAPAKLPHVAALMKAGARIRIITDSVGGAMSIARHGNDLSVRFETLIEIDSDGHRAGLSPNNAVIAELAQLLNTSDGSCFGGVITHAGGSYTSSSQAEISDYAERERQAVVQAARIAENAGQPCGLVSLGSTPTALFAERMDGVSEARAGVYVFQDLVMAGLGVCAPDEIALSVLCSVIGSQSDKNWILVDAGWMAMSRDRGTAGQTIDQGYGLVADVDGRIFGDLILIGVNQEHGIIADRHGRPLDRDEFPLGTLLRVLPNHACATAAQHGHYWVVNGGREIAENWARENGW